MSAPSVTSGRSGEFAGQRGVSNRWAQVGEAAQGLPQLQQPGLWAFIWGKGIEFIASNSAEQDGIAFQRRVQRCRWQRRAMLTNRNAANRHFRKFKLITVHLRHGAENAHSLPRYFRANAVARYDCHFQVHKRNPRQFAFVWLVTMAALSCWPAGRDALPGLRLWNRSSRRHILL